MFANLADGANDKGGGVAFARGGGGSHGMTTCSAANAAALEGTAHLG